MKVLTLARTVFWAAMLAFGGVLFLAAPVWAR